MNEFKERVIGCNDSEFYNIECLETEYQFGFFKDDNDIRPSSCTWIDKEKAVKLWELFVKLKAEDICKCGHSTNDHSHPYPINLENNDLECDICDCKKFVSSNKEVKG